MGSAFRFPKSQRFKAGDECDHDWTEESRTDFVDTGTTERSPKGPLYFMVLTCSTGGLQVVWSLIMSNGTPFLITLGLHESLTAAVWIVAPLCGVLIQPYVGILSDNCECPWGRRKPFILIGAAGSVLCMLGLASTKSACLLFANAIHVDIHGPIIRGLALASAILWLIGLNLFIQPLQSGIRALIVDSCVADQQVRASAWASKMTGVGNIIGYFFGFVPLHDFLPFLHITQFSWLCLVASGVLVTTTLLTCACVREKDPRSIPAPASMHLSFSATVKHIVWSVTTMPTVIRRVCHIQFWAWLGWFGYLYYGSTYVGDLYAAPLLARDSHMGSASQARIIEDAIRLGSLASLVFAVFALLTNILIPSFVHRGSCIRESSRASGLFNLPISMNHAWSISHFLFSFCMFSTFYIRTQTAATVLAAFVGISWALTLWVPFAIIGGEVAVRQEKNAKIFEGDIELVEQDQAGVIIGLHNCAISLPQILAALVCGGILWVASKTGSQDGVGWVLRFSGCGGLVAGYLAARIDS
ncbi:hypothetical protein EJ08DRAFT_581345 [Tothia fuscella]|uniref:Sucrose transporter n=1 Tax=Tothia fuscella TaxID=1048955 RepID=A0A9P4NYN2_9PEZI|nr:hypothetical protein EJ08DRAFT_581345 [Tothia fuscella]